MEVNSKPVSSQSHELKNQTQTAGSWTRFFIRAGLSVTALGVVSQLVYNNHYSPSHPDYQGSTSFEGQLSSGCESLAFRSSQAFYNTFETSGAFFNKIGLPLSTPTGDLQAFALDRNIEALDCAYSSYPQDRVSDDNKNKLLGKVLKGMQLHHKELNPSLKWLLHHGANPNHQERMGKEAKQFSEKAYTPLLTAYRALDADLYDYLISKGASASREIDIQSNDSSKSDEKQMILHAMIDDIKHQFSRIDESDLELEEAYRCPIYKKMVDASLSQLTSAQSFSEQEATRAKVDLYMRLNPHACSSTFTISQEEKRDYDAEQIKNAFKNTYEWWTQFSQSETTDEASQTAGGPNNSAKSYPDDQTPGWSQKAFEKAQNTFSDVYQSKTAQTVVQMVKDGSQKAAQAGSYAVNTVSDVVTSETVIGIGQGIKKVVKKTVRVGADTLKGAAELVSNAATSETVKGIGQSVKKGAQKLAEVGSETLKAVGDGAKAAANSDLAASAAKGIKQVAQTTAEIGSKTLKAVGDGAKAAANSELVAGIGKGIKQGTQSASEMGQVVFESGKGVFITAKENAKDAVSAAADTFAELTQQKKRSEIL